MVAIQPPSAAADSEITQTPARAGGQRDPREPQREHEEEQSERMSLGRHPGQGYNPPRHLGA